MLRCAEAGSGIAATRFHQHERRGLYGTTLRWCDEDACCNTGDLAAYCAAACEKYDAVVVGMHCGGDPWGAVGGFPGQFTNCLYQCTCSNGDGTSTSPLCGMGPVQRQRR